MTERQIPAEADSPPPPEAEEIKPPWGQEAVVAAYPRIQAFVFSRLGRQQGEDVVGKVLEVLLGDLERVNAKTQSGFFSWCYGVAHNKVMDALRSKYRDKLVPMAPDDLMKLMEDWTEAPGFSPGVLADLRFIFGLLRAANSPCVELLQEHILFGVKANIMAAKYGIEVAAMRRRIERCFAGVKELAKKHR